MSHLPIWYLSELPQETCDQALEELKNLQRHEAGMGIDGEVNNLVYRNTAVSFAPFDFWLSSIFEKFSQQANETCAWDYDVDTREAIQFAEYGVDQHYSWHCDTFVLSGKPIDRKITVVCLLNDEFEGGEFEIRLNSVYSAPLKKGTMIAFPSVLDHRVTPVLSGTRYSATAWFSGPRFR